jgi:hypothetical protein
VKAFGIVCASFLFCITNVCAKDEVSAWVGVSRIELKDNKGMFANSLENIIKSDSPTFSAPTVGLEYMHGIRNNYKIGTRLGALYKNINITLNSGSVTIKDNDTYCRIIIIPIMFGGSYSKNISKKFSLNGKSFLGYVPINFRSKNSFVNTSKDLNKKIVKELDKTIGCFILDFSIGIEWLFTKRFGVGLDVGYRFTPEVMPSKDIKIDFSGATFTLGLSYKI